jgi:hypothetical protein
VDTRAAKPQMPHASVSEPCRAGTDQPVPPIWAAIEQTCMIRLIYHDKEGILEPHDHGILNGSVQLLEVAPGSIATIKCQHSIAPLARIEVPGENAF